MNSFNDLQAIYQVKLYLFRPIMYTNWNISV